MKSNTSDHSTGRALSSASKQCDSSSQKTRKRQKGRQKEVKNHTKEENSNG